jgi:hypothetical protein
MLQLVHQKCLPARGGISAPKANSGLVLLHFAQSLVERLDVIEFFLI